MRRSNTCDQSLKLINVDNITSDMHTHKLQKAATNQQSRHNHKVNRKLHQVTESIHDLQKPTSIQRQIKTGVPKSGPSHPHYLTFTLQTYQHLEPRFRSCEHQHTQARVQSRNT